MRIADLAPSAARFIEELAAGLGRRPRSVLLEVIQRGAEIDEEGHLLSLPIGGQWNRYGVLYSGSLITSLAPQLPRLRKLDLVFGGIRALDLSGLPALEELITARTPMEELDASPCPRLRKLRCNNGRLARLRLSQNTALEDLHIAYCEHLVACDLPLEAPLRALDLCAKHIAEVDLSGFRTLEKLRLRYVGVTQLDLREHAVEELELGDLPELALLSVPPSLTKLTLTDLPRLRALDLSACRGLKSAEIKNCRRLKTIQCTETQAALAGLKARRRQVQIVAPPAAPAPVPPPRALLPAPAPAWEWWAQAREWLASLPPGPALDEGIDRVREGIAQAHREGRVGSSWPSGSLNDDPPGLEGQWWGRHLNSEDPRATLLRGFTYFTAKAPLSKLVQPGRLANLRRLYFYNSRLSKSGLQKLLRQADLRQLEALEIDQRDLHPGCGVALAEALGQGRLPSLRTLELSAGAAFAPGAAALLTATAPQLRVLKLTSTKMVVGDLPDRWGGCGLEELNLNFNHLCDAGFARLAQANLPSLRKLSLYSCDIEHLGPLADAAWATSLQELTLSSNPLRPAAIAALAQAPLPSLTSLWLAGAYDRPLSAQQLAPLLQAPWVSQLRYLDLGGHDLDEAIVELLTATDALAGLETLCLNSADIDNLSRASKDALLERFAGHINYW
ncbi:MAG: hypothetical protein AAFV53_21745 [Myxococcota bacterium]